jgi:hypothetical protein
LEGLSFVDAAEAVKQFWLENGNLTGRFTAQVKLVRGASIKIIGLATSSDMCHLVKVGKDGPTFVIWRVLECSFCSLNAHLHEDCQICINLLSAQVGPKSQRLWGGR